MTGARPVAASVATAECEHSPFRNRLGSVSNPDSTTPVPLPLRWAGGLVAFQGALGLAVAVFLVIRAAGGNHHEDFISGYGTALWFVLIGGGVLAGGLAVYQGRRWGRAIALLTQLLLIPVGWSLLTDSNLPVFGAPLLALVVVVLCLLFAPVSQQYWAADSLPPDA